MEAIMVGGLAVLAVGGYFSVMDFMTDLGLHRKKTEIAVTRLPISRRYTVTPQTGIKKMAGMHI